MDIVVALDWTEFDKDDPSTIAAYLVTSHGRATPLVWKTVRKSKLKNQRNEHEYQVIRRLHAILPIGVKITLLADRGFGDQKLFTYLGLLGWSYAIRFRQLIQVTVAERTMAASKWVPISGHVKRLRDVLITGKKTRMPAVVLKHQKGMKQASLKFPTQNPSLRNNIDRLRAVSPVACCLHQSFGRVAVGYMQSAHSVKQHSSV